MLRTDCGLAAIRGRNATVPGASNAFVIYRSTNYQYYFVLKGGNGQVLVTSETYTTKQSALDGINSVKRVVPIARVVDAT